MAAWCKEWQIYGAGMQTMRKGAWSPRSSLGHSWLRYSSFTAMHSAHAFAAWKPAEILSQPCLVCFHSGHHALASN